MELYGTISNVDETIYTCYMRVDVPPTKRQCDCGADLLTVSEYCINKHWTRVQAQATGNHQGESVIAHCVLLGSSSNTRCFLPATRIIVVNSHTYCCFNAYKIVMTV